MPSPITPTAPAQVDSSLWNFARRLDQALASGEVEFFIITAITEEWSCAAFMEMPAEREQDPEREAAGTAIGGGTGAAFILSLEGYGHELRSVLEEAQDQAQDEIGSGGLQLYGIEYQEQYPDQAKLVCTYIDETGRRLIMNFPVRRREQHWTTSGFSVWHDILEEGEMIERLRAKKNRPGFFECPSFK